jgi:hypothetical protein
MQGILSLFQHLLPFDFLQRVQDQAGVRRNNSVYSALVVLWLMVYQRLCGGAPLQAAVFGLLGGLPSSFWPQPCKRLLDWRGQRKIPSSYTGAYNQARQSLPRLVVQQATDRIFEELIGEIDRRSTGAAVRVFVLDGSTVRAAHTPSSCRIYPPGSNQHGEAHFPLVRVLVAHDLYTGLAMRPEFGAMHGPDAVSEQQLVESAISRLPEGSILMGDANLGVFSVAYAGVQTGHPVLLRLTTVRARHLAGGNLRDGIRRSITWRPSRWDRNRHPELAADACVKGRLIVRRVQPDNGESPFLLAMFTTLPGSSRELLNLYGQRWNIETDLRTLKSTLRLEQLASYTPDMLAKEIEIGMAAYNLVRAITWLASEQSGIPPRGYSFTTVRRILEVFTPKIAAAADPATADQIFDEMMQCIQRAKLPHRNHKRPSYPRRVLMPQKGYPARTHKPKTMRH